MKGATLGVCPKSSGRQPGTAFRHREEPFGIGDGNRSSCPEADTHITLTNDEVGWIPDLRRGRSTSGTGSLSAS